MSFKCPDLQCTKNSTYKGYNIKIFPKKARLYSSQKVRDIEKYRITWYGDRRVAMSYRSEYKPCYRYVAQDNLRLLDISDKRNIIKLHDSITNTEDRNVVALVGGMLPADTLKKYTSYNKYPLVGISGRLPDNRNYLAPVGYYSKEDYSKKLYLNKRFAIIICKYTGLDGWIVPNDKVWDVSRDDFYSPEIMLCSSFGHVRKTNTSCNYSLYKENEKAWLEL